MDADRRRPSADWTPPLETSRAVERRTRRLRLPLIDRRMRAPAIVVGALLLIALFMLPARLHLGEPIPLDRSFVDDRIPFLEWTIWIYLSEYPFLVLAIWLAADDKRRSDAAYGLVLAALIGLVIFTLVPTSVMRQSPDLIGATGLLWRFLFSVDTTVNAFPSLHVANTCLAAVAFSSRSGPWRIVVPLWAALVILSTLTTKQHYAIDVPAGFILAAVCFVLVRFGAEYKRIGDG